jgi:hypothetical protein
MRRTRGVTMPEQSDGKDTAVAFNGEVWTDARGYATVALPRSAGWLHGNVAYELRSFSPDVAATVAAELLDGRFTIATDEPHVKVAWRVTNRRPELRTKEEK